MNPPKPLPSEALFTPCDPAAFSFETTDQLEVLDDIVGQERAVTAVRFAIGMNAEGYNLFAFGPEGTGKASLVRKFLEQKAAQEPVPDDWAYVNNFTEPHRPKVLRMPPGRIRPLAEDMEQLVEDLLAAIPAAFESDEYQARKEELEDRFKEGQGETLKELQDKAGKKDITVFRTSSGLAVAPIHEGEVMKTEDFQNLPDDIQDRYRAAMEEVQEELADTFRDLPKWEKEHRKRIRDLDSEVTEIAVDHLIRDLRGRYADFPEVQAYLGEVRRDVIKNATDFLPREKSGPEGLLPPFLQHRESGLSALRRYQVNVIIDHCNVIEDDRNGAGDADAGGDDEGEGGGPVDPGAPVVEEDHPTQPNLIGRIEHLAQMGTLFTDFTMIKPGALHRANGGYLILDARKVLMQPFAWEALKQALSSGSVRFENPADSYGIMSTVSLDPEPIPLNIKVMLLGEGELYYLLTRHDPEFRELFKVAADFDSRMERNDDNALLLARLVATLGKREHLRPLDRGGVARVVEHGARMADDAERLSTHMGSVVDLVREADYFAGEETSSIVTRDHVQQAIDAKVYRSDRLRERIQEEIERGTILIDTAGERVGEVNGLAVFQLDHFSFGKPSRISCRVHLGRGEVVDIEREVTLGGPLHTKGVLILSSYLTSRYAGDMPLALAASLVFEQSYGGVDGDSASSTELYALISAIAEVPLKQSLAVTGSVDQNGRVQAIGGVNEKIEGFFDVCRARGLTGDQGVLIPAANVKHLMLREDIVQAVSEAKFAIYAVATIDQGIEILTGLEAGDKDASGTYPIGSVNRMVQARLKASMLAAMRLAAQAQPHPKNGNH